jgi:hypothetical protein
MAAKTQKFEIQTTVTIGHFHPRVFQKWVAKKSKAHSSAEMINRFFKNLDTENRGYISKMRIDDNSDVIEDVFQNWAKVKRMLNFKYRDTMISLKAF